ncbi:hypothetical protein PAPHI01_1913 [Pancytospora philotis]|nr:hypothetical protein PAPHI01_1913 [Pancytospora philotis]
MVDRARKLLDRLMGPERNATSSTFPCINHGLGLCPRSLLSGTKRDAGECTLAHVPLEIPARQLAQHEKTLLKELMGIIARYGSAKSRDASIRAHNPAYSEKIKQLDGEIAEHVRALPRANNTASEMALIKKKSALLRKMKETASARRGVTERARCAVCWEFVVPDASDDAHSKHTNGRLHRAFVQIRSKIGELAAKYDVRTMAELSRL